MLGEFRSVEIHASWKQDAALVKQGGGGALGDGDLEAAECHSAASSLGRKFRSLTGFHAVIETIWLPPGATGSSRHRGASQHSCACHTVHSSSP
jgi:hypothetical protein